MTELKNFSLPKVLVVEDQKAIATNLRYMLQDLGADEVRVAGSIHEALGELDGNVFDLAIVDVQLGQDSGLPIADRCGDLKIPVILSSGHAEISRPNAAATEIFLPKPYSFATLYMALEAVLRRGKL